MTHILIMTETKNKAGRFHYKVLDQAGNVVSERKSNRLYVACTINGQYYFGRRDLVGKGEHGQQISSDIAEGRQPVEVVYIQQQNFINS